MNDFLDFARYFILVSLLVAGCAAVWRSVSRHYDRPGEER